MHAYYIHSKLIVVFVVGLSVGFFFSYCFIKSSDIDYLHPSYNYVRREDGFDGTIYHHGLLHSHSELDLDTTVQETQIWSDFRDYSHSGELIPFIFCHLEDEEIKNRKYKNSELSSQIGNK